MCSFTLPFLLFYVENYKIQSTHDAYNGTVLRFRILGKKKNDKVLSAQRLNWYIDTQKLFRHKQNANLTWYTNDPDFTVCFQKTVLVWTPCLWLWTFLWLEIIYIKHSMSRNIPWGLLNVSKLALTTALILLTAIDLCVAISQRNGIILRPVDYCTPLIKLTTFVSEIPTYSHYARTHYNR